MNNRFKIKMNDGTISNVVIEDYNAKDIADELNSPEKHMIALGDVVVQRYSVIRITPIDKIEDTEETE